MAPPKYWCGICKQGCSNNSIECVSCFALDPPVSMPTLYINDSFYSLCCRVSVAVQICFDITNIIMLAALRAPSVWGRRTDKFHLVNFPTRFTRHRLVVRRQISLQ